MVEEWRSIPGIDGYEASSHGRVRSIRRLRVYIHKGRECQRVFPSKVLKPTLMTKKDGSLPYEMVDICNMPIGLKRPYGVHRLVCMAFHGPPPSEKHQAAHGDGNSLNNEPGNLRWATVAENCADKFDHGTQPLGEQTYIAKLTSEQVLRIRQELAGGARQTDLAGIYGVAPSSIQSIASGRNWAWLS